MFLDYIRNNIFEVAVLEPSVLHSQWQPPKLHLDALLVKILHHFLDRASSEGVLSRLPVPVVVKPAVIEGGPMNPQLFQLGDGVLHLFRRYIRLISPAT